MLQLVVTQVILPALFWLALFVIGFGAFPDRYDLGAGVLGESRFEREARRFWRALWWGLFLVLMVASIFFRDCPFNDFVVLWNFLRDVFGWW